MTILKAIAVAFSQYSKIPMPQFEWKEKEMSFYISAFPLIGAVIGAVVCLWDLICEKAGIGSLARSLVLTVIPLAVTGGFHLDGFMDTSDALSSYGDREKKLEILKDSHIGAFAVIRTIMAVLIYAAALSEIQDHRMIEVLAIGFVLSRALSGLAVVSWNSARKKGMLFFTASHANRKANRVILLIWIVACVLTAIRIDFKSAILLGLAAVAAFGYYRYMSYKEFQGITGDLAGYFVVICEGIMAVCLAVAAHVF